MKFVCVSDTHTKHGKLGSSLTLPDGDVLLHAGDFSNVGGRHEVDGFFNWLIKQAPRYTYGIVFIAGNHDKSFDTKYKHLFAIKEAPGGKPQWLIDMLEDLTEEGSNVTYLENSSIELNGTKIWGSPYSPWYYGDRWAFNKRRGKEIAEVWNLIPVNTDIVITHTPVAYKLDWIPSTQEYVGCYDLGRRLEDVRPRLHVSGHIHESFGVDRNLDTTFINASTCNEYYDAANEPIVVTIEDGEVTVEDKQ